MLKTILPPETIKPGTIAYSPGLPTQAPALRISWYLLRTFKPGVHLSISPSQDLRNYLMSLTGFSTFQVIRHYVAEPPVVLAKDLKRFQEILLEISR